MISVAMELLENGDEYCLNMKRLISFITTKESSVHIVKLLTIGNNIRPIKFTFFHAESCHCTAAHSQYLQTQFQTILSGNDTPSGPEGMSHH